VNISLGAEVLFDERPKVNKKELFDREKEIEEIISNLNSPLLIITGIRRIGKTSVMNVALNESKIPFIVIDCRKLKENYSRAELYRVFSEALSSILDKIKEILSRIRGITILGNFVEISWKGRNFVSLSDLFDHLNERRLIIALDEAQRLRGPLSKEIKDAIAHSYDYNRNLTFILTGSEVGLLYDFIGIEDPKSPLYGRYFHEIKIERFDKETSLNFMRKGFEELNLKVDEKTLNEIVEMFDGIPGWLVFAGNYYYNKRNINEIKEAAISVALQEIKNFIEEKRKQSIIVARRYENLLKCLSKGFNSWSKLLRCLEDAEGSSISTSVLDNLIKNLEKMSTIKDYNFLDPIYADAVKRL
jgi:AAA+ ATPase superfamily predicted ATPase